MSIINKPLVSSSDSESFRYVPDRFAVVPLTGHVGSFAHKRKNHTHEGLDIYLHEGTPIYAKEAGRVIDIVNFTGPKAGSDWWNDTQAVVIEHETCGIVLYGEIDPHESLYVGCTVNQGDCIGFVSTVLKVDKGRPLSMLHIESYTHYTRPFIWEGAPTTIPVKSPLFLFDIPDIPKTTLFVAGYFSRDGGKRSTWCDSFIKQSGEFYPTIDFVNGGSLDVLAQLCEQCGKYDRVIWWANVDNSESKITPFDKSLKRLIISKNNRDMSYTTQDLKERMHNANATGLIEFHKSSTGIAYRIHSDHPLGHWWSGNNPLNEYLFKDGYEN